MATSQLTWDWKEAPVSKELRGWIVRLAVTLVVVGVVFFVGLAVNSYLDPFDDRPFDQAAWAAAEIERDRGPMARDAIRHIPSGTSRERVRELLGETGCIPVGGDRWGVKPRQSETWEYYIGSWSAIGPYGLDSAFLHVHFDRDGRVVAAEINGG